MKRSTLFALASALTFAAFATAQPAQAQEVRYGDLNLSSDAGADALISRIRQMARVSCGEHAGPMMWSEYRYVENCRRETELSEIEAINNSYVRSRYEQRFGRGSAWATSR
jgi:UrcA family protein